MTDSQIKHVSIDLLIAVCELAIRNYKADPSIVMALEPIGYTPEMFAALEAALIAYVDCLRQSELGTSEQVAATEILSESEENARDMLRALRLLCRIALKEDRVRQRLLGIDQPLASSIDECTNQGDAFYAQLKNNPELQGLVLEMGVTPELYLRGENLLNNVRAQRATQQRKLSATAEMVVERKEKRAAVVQQLTLFHEHARFGLRNKLARYEELGDRLLRNHKRGNAATTADDHDDAASLVVENLTVENLSVEHLDVDEAAGAATNTDTDTVESSSTDTA